MKSLFYLLITLFTICCYNVICAQSTSIASDLVMAEKQVSKRDIRKATQERIKELEDEGWKAVGATSICQAVETAFLLKKVTVSGAYKYIQGIGTAKGSIESLTQANATAQATNNIVISMQTEVLGQIQTRLKQLQKERGGLEEAIDFMASFSSEFKTKLPPQIPIITMRRRTADSMYEYQVWNFCDITQVTNEIGSILEKHGLSIEDMMR